MLPFLRRRFSGTENTPEQLTASNVAQQQVPGVTILVIKLGLSKTISQRSKQLQPNLLIALWLSSTYANVFYCIHARIFHRFSVISDMQRVLNASYGISNKAPNCAHLWLQSLQQF